MNIQEAIKAMEEGKSVVMKDWNYPKGSYLKILPMPLLPEVNDFYLWVEGQVGYQPFALRYTAYNAQWILVNK